MNLFRESIRMTASVFFLTILVCVFATPSIAQGVKLTNPILAGFYPDPSVVKAGDDYYLINSTFSYFPGIPVFHSRDLAHWKQIGNVISRPSQMNFMGERMTRGLFAPAISYHEGIFYVTCTLIDRGGNFVVTAKNPAGPWSNPTFLPQVRGIDPSLFFDKDKAYIIYNSDAPDNKPTYSGHRTLRMYEFDYKNLKVTGEERTVVNGGVDITAKPVWIEGPHILKRGDWYYLYAAEGGTSVNHSEVVFRSKNAMGPFIPFEGNPILTQRNLPADRKFPVTSTGHAQFVEGPDGKDYAIFLAVRPYSGDFYNTGRETFIAPVQWQNEWPVINPGLKEVQYQYKTSIKNVSEKNTLPQSGNFEYTLNFKNGLDPSLLFLRSVDSSLFSFKRDNSLALKLSPETCLGSGTPAFVGKRQQHLNCSAETEITFVARAENEKAGLVIFQDETHFYYLCKSSEGSEPMLQLYKSNTDSKSMDLLAQVKADAVAGPTRLRIVAEEEYYSFYYGNASGPWTLLKDKVDAKFLSTKVAGGFIGCVFGMYATSSGQLTTNEVLYQYLRYNGNDPVYLTSSEK